MKRESGILMPIFSLPSKYGIGDFGDSAFKFVDFLKNSNQKIWQILPLVQTGYGDSPYSSICSFSFNPYFISPEILFEQKLITKSELNDCVIDSKYIEYGKLYDLRFTMLKKAFNRFDISNKDFKTFVSKKQFIDYAIFMAISKKFNYIPFYDWEDNYKFRDEETLKNFEKENINEIMFWLFIQYESKREWQLVKKYANQNSIKIIGDMPLYVATNSVDVWQNPRLFDLDENLKPNKIAGVPPDYFCADGQLWGNPVFDYKYHKENNFSWWINRLKFALSIYDYVRIDHFRGLDRFYQVDSSATNARVGEWVKVPSIELFDSIHQNIKNDRIIAEDLGIIDDGVRALLKYTGYPGMKILSFAFNGDDKNLYLPENVEENSICYTGTHDNDTLIGLIDNLSDWDYNNLINGVKNSLKLFGIRINLDSNKKIATAMIELGFACKSKLFIMPMADLLLLNGEYRINRPGVVSNKNWSVRFEKKSFSKVLQQKLKNYTKKYNR